MNDEQPIQLSKWYGLLIFAAGSILTAIAARTAPYDRGNALLSMILFYWMLFGLAAGGWILRGRSWKALSPSVRQRLALAYLAVGWGGLFGLALDSSIVNLVIFAAGVVLAVMFVKSSVASQQRKQDEGDIFP
ncbi:MAG TPA: hypothetical protein VJG32_23025 [Anaerolineae bacterium]|nr:hypothetical protein [Anaerolineae bacterium]